MWCVAELNEAYIANMEEVLVVYEKPVCLHADVRPCRPTRPGHIAKRDNEYKRPASPTSSRS